MGSNGVSYRRHLPMGRVLAGCRKGDKIQEKGQNLSHNQAIRVGYLQMQTNSSGTEGDIGVKNGHWNTYKGLG